MIDSSYWLVEGELLAGGYPSSFSASIARKKLEAILDAGVRSFIDLTESHELAPYDELLFELARARDIEVSYQRISIRDLGVPAEDVMTAILDRIRSEIAAGRPVYVHCWGGIGRTGTVAGCWLVEQGLACDEAFERIRTLRRHTPDRWTRSPETDNQREFVRGWIADH